MSVRQLTKTSISEVDFFCFHHGFSVEIHYPQTNGQFSRFQCLKFTLSKPVPPKPPEPVLSVAQRLQRSRPVGLGTRHCSKEWELLEVSSYEAHQVGPLCWPMNETLAAHLRFVLQARGFKSIDMFLEWQDKDGFFFWQGMGLWYLWLMLVFFWHLCFWPKISVVLVGRGLTSHLQLIPQKFLHTPYNCVIPRVTAPGFFPRFLSMYFSWPPLAIAAACAITFSHMWTRILRDHAHCLAWIGLYILVMLPLFLLAFRWLWNGHIESPLARRRLR